jgi:RNA polymerase sigma-70 factor, ECF subfamily
MTDAFVAAPPSAGSIYPAAPMACRAPGVPDPDEADATLRLLYQENARFVLNYVTRLLGDRHLAEDVVQETMLRAWRHWGRISLSEGSARSWLVRVAHNIAMDKVRTRRSRPPEVAQAAAPEPQVGDHADAVVTAVHVRQALATLSPSHRAVLEQVYLNGLTAGEAAAVLGIPEGTVFSRTYYALHTLRRQLGQPADGPPRTQQRPRARRKIAA